MSKSYKEMSSIELVEEIIRVRDLLVKNKKPHTYHQNRKYLEKLEIEYQRRIYEKKNN